MLVIPSLSLSLSGWLHSLLSWGLQCRINHWVGLSWLTWCTHHIAIKNIVLDIPLSYAFVLLTEQNSWALTITGEHVSLFLLFLSLSPPPHPQRFLMHHRLLFQESRGTHRDKGERSLALPRTKFHPWPRSHSVSSTNDEHSDLDPVIKFAMRGEQRICFLGFRYSGLSGLCSFAYLFPCCVFLQLARQRPYDSTVPSCLEWGGRMLVNPRGKIIFNSLNWTNWIPLQEKKLRNYVFCVSCK